MKKIFKFLGFGCLGFLALIVFLGIVGAIFSNDEEYGSQELSESSFKSTIIDSVKLKKDKRIRDSLNNVKKVKHNKALKELSKFRKKTDEFEGTSFYQDRRTPRYTNVNFIYPYIGEKDDYFWLRLKFQYASDDWLFIKKAVLLIDGEKYTINGNWERDNNSRIWEWLDISVGSNEKYLLDKIASSKSAKVRYIGMQYRNDRTITSKEKNIIRKTLDVYNGVQ